MLLGELPAPLANLGCCLIHRYLEECQLKICSYHIHHCVVFEIGDFVILDLSCFPTSRPKRLAFIRFQGSLSTSKMQERMHQLKHRLCLDIRTSLIFIHCVLNTSTHLRQWFGWILAPSSSTTCACQERTRRPSYLQTSLLQPSLIPNLSLQQFSSDYQSKFAHHQLLFTSVLGQQDKNSRTLPKAHTSYSLATRRNYT